MMTLLCGSKLYHMLLKILLSLDVVVLRKFIYTLANSLGALVKTVLS